MSEQKTEPVLNPKILGEVDIPKIDLSMYHGKRAVIQGYEFKESEYGVYAIVKTLPIEGVDDSADVYATRLLNLYEKKDEETKETLGYGWGAESKTGLFMKKMNATTFDDLVGKEVVVFHEMVKGGKEFLSF